DLGGDRLDVRHDVRREDDDASLRDLAEEIAKAHALLRVEADRRLVHNDELRVPEQRLRDADALTHAAGVAAEAPVGDAMEVRELEQLLHAAVEVGPGEPLQPAEVEKELACGQLLVDAEVLREI